MSCYHCNMMGEYYAMREAQEQRAEQYSAGYATETAEFYQNEERVNFRSFLQERMMTRD